MFYRIFIPLLVFIFCALGLSRFHLSVDAEDNLDKNSAEYRVYDKSKAIFGNDGAVFVGMQLSRKLSETRLSQLVNRVETKLSKIPTLTKVSSEFSRPVFISDDHSIEVFEQSDFLGTDTSYETLNLPPLVSKDGKYIFIKAEVPELSIKQKLLLRKQLYEIKLGLLSDYLVIENIAFTGELFLAAAQADAATDNLHYIFPLMYFAFFLVFSVFYKSFGLLIVHLSICLASVLSMLGLYSWFGFGFSPVSLASVTTLFAINSAAICHFIVKYFYYRKNFAFTDAINKTQKTARSPIIICALTTMLGFLLLNTSTMPPLVHLGNAVAIGIVLMLFYTFSLLPLCLQFLDKNLGRKHFLLPASTLLTLHKTPKTVLLVLSAIVLLAAFGFLQLKVFDDPANHFSNKVRYQKDLISTQKSFPYLYHATVIIKDKKGRKLIEREAFQDIRGVIEQIKSLPNVSYVSSIVDVVDVIDQIMNAGKTNVFEQNLLAQYLLIYELSAAEPELNTFIDTHHKYTKLSVSLKLSDTDSVSAFVNAVRKLNKQHPDIDLTVTGLPVIYQSLVSKTVYDVALSGLLALLAISTIALLLFKSLKIVFILLIVNTLPYAIVMGICGHFVGNVTPQIAIVFAVTIGIVFDDSLYLVLKFMEEKQNSNRWEVLLKTTMPAILMTTLAFAIGFYVTMLSSFIPTVIFGFLAGSVMLTALLLDLILLPILLNLFMSPDDELSV